MAFILGVGLLGLAALITGSIRASAGSRQRDTAAYLANNVLESLAADGRLSASFRSNAQTIPTTYLLANATDGAANDFQAADVGGTQRTTFDMEGRPSATNPVFSVEWVRRATKSVAPVVSSSSMTAEVVVNVTWSEAQGAAITQKWLSCSRMIRY
ncbi:MAG: hypothetical protein Q8O00_05330 [Holophaga sp.]|nr:hypothetical protein [Holophaga sp.]